MSYRLLRAFLTIMALALATASLVFGQGAATGSISGRVSDPANAAVPGATIKLTNTSTGVQYNAATTSDGYYVVRFLPPGNYTVEVTKQGFQKAVQPGVVVTAAGSATANVKLALGSVTQTVTVSESVGNLELQNADRGAEIDSTRMANTPSQARNVMGMAWSSPGLTVTSNAKSFTNSDNSGSTSISINGGQPKTNEMIIDGVPDLGGAAGVYGTIPTQEIVSEMKVITNAYSAEYGRTTGGVINVVTKSGTNAFHGELYEYNRSTGLAANWFERNLAGRDKLPIHVNMAGGVLTGPAIKDKVFFTFETARYHITSQKSYIGNVPTALERSGDFSQTYALVNGQPKEIMIYDPWSTRYDPTTGQYTRQSFLSETGANAIPASRINPVALGVFKYIPLPNAQGTPYTNSNNYVPSGGGQPREDTTNLMPRVDWNINDNTRLTVRYIRNNYNSYDVEFYPNAADVNTGFPFNRSNHNVSIDLTRTLSPTSVLDVRVGMQRYLTFESHRSAGTSPAVLGFSQNFVSEAANAFPVFRFGGSAGYGGSVFSGAGSPAGNVDPDQINNLDVAWSKITGRHSIKIGGQERLERAYHTSAGNSAGAFSFSPTVTTYNPQISDPAAGNPVASFLLGVGSSGSIDLNSAPARQSLSTALYFQDDIKVTSRLTLNAGLRWDYTGPMTDRYNSMTGTFSPDQLSPLQPPGFRTLYGGLTFPGVGGISRSVYDATYTNFGPRLGFAYAVDNKTAIRGGYGLFYGPIWYDPGSSGFSQSTPWVTTDPNLIPLNLVDNPFPNGLLQPVGASNGLATNLGQGISFIDPHAREPRSQQFSFEIQRELPFGLRGSVGYTLNKVDRLPVSKDLNAWTLDQLALGAAGLNQKVANPFAGLVPGTSLNQSTISYGQLIKPFPQFSSVVENDIPIGSSRYDSVQFYLLKRLSHGLSFSVAYTVSKKIDKVGYQYPTDTQLEKAIDVYDIPQIWVLNGSWELPFGRGQYLASNAPSIVNRIIGGWQFNYMIRLQKGMPFGFPTNVMPVAGVDPTDIAGGQTLNHWINPAAYIVNNNPYIPRRWDRISGRLRTPPIHNFDLGITKNNKITERVNFQIMGLFINAFNTPQFWNGPTNCSSPASSCFGQIAGYNSQTNYPRQIQLAGRITF